MPDDDRLRELQRRAYGAGGGLNAEEAAELAELQAAVRMPVAVTPPVVPHEAEEPSSPVVERARNERDETHSAPERVAASESRLGSEDVSSRVARSATRKKSILLTALAVASALLIGLGAGWMLFGRDSGPAMDAKQQKAWTEFEASGDYDSGSIRMLGEQYGITVWYATQKNAKTECVMLTPSKQVSIACQPLELGDGEQEGRPVPLSAQVDLEDDEGTVVNGVVVRDVHGVPTAVLQQWRNDPGQWLDMFEGDERALAEMIADETGKDGFLQIIGYDGETPIWLAQDGETCLYAANLGGIVQQSCDADSSNVVLEMQNATYGLRETNHGTALITLAGHETPILGDDGVKIEG